METQSSALPVPPLTDEQRADLSKVANGFFCQGRRLKLGASDWRWRRYREQATPETVLALLAENDSLRSRLSEAEAAVNGFAVTMSKPYQDLQHDYFTMKQRAQAAEAAVEVGERATRPHPFPANTPPETQEWHFCQCGDDVVLLFWGYPDDEYGSTDFYAEPTWCEFVDTYDPTEHIVSAFWPRPKAVSPACQRDCQTCESRSVIDQSPEIIGFYETSGLPVREGDDYVTDVEGCYLTRAEANALAEEARGQTCEKKAGDFGPEDGWIKDLLAGTEPAGGAGAGLQGEPKREGRVGLDGQIYGPEEGGYA